MQLWKKNDWEINSKAGASGRLPLSLSQPQEINDYCLGVVQLEVDKNLLQYYKYNYVNCTNKFRVQTITDADFIKAIKSIKSHAVCISRDMTIFVVCDSFV